MNPELSARKDSHLDLCLDEDVERQTSTLFDDVHLLHDALPEIAVGDVSLETAVLGRTLRAPLFVSGMTGGTPRAAAVNRDLAAAAQRAGVAFGVGSQRPMAVNPDATASYAVRDVAPDVLLFGNIGAQQLVQLGVPAVRELMERIGADAIFIHLNPAQELVQPEGDRSFTGCLDAIRRLADALGPRVWVKETGCGLSRSVAQRLVAAGVGGLDVSGAGGTSWTRVEMLRASGAQRELGGLLSGWGVPTAAAVAACSELGVPVVASGGVRSSLDWARALALGASFGAMALPFLRAQSEGGADAVARRIDELVAGLRAILLLTGSRDSKALRSQPKVLTGELPRWIDAMRAGAPSQQFPGRSS